MAVEKPVKNNMGKDTLKIEENRTLIHVAITNTIGVNWTGVSN